MSLSLRTLAAALLLTSPVYAGGAWIPAKGDGTSQLGYSRKTATTSWNSSGDSFVHGQEGNRGIHDFRYAYLQGETGLGRGFSVTYLVTWLYGLEGPGSNPTKNPQGFSDAWFGMKYGLVEGDFPVALALTLRTPMFYDIKGPYNGNLFNADGSVRGRSPEWRGLLKHDLSLTGMVSHSFDDGKGWWTAETGYTWREGAPANQVPLRGDVGYHLPWYRIRAKAFAEVVLSVGNQSVPTETDRFRNHVPGSNTNFNDASMARVAFSAMVPLDHAEKWMFEAGYGWWVWGESARQYSEPFLSFSRSF